MLFFVSKAVEEEIRECFLFILPKARFMTLKYLRDF